MPESALIRRQRIILRKTDYRTPEASPDRLRRFGYYQPPLGKDLTPPVTADEATAKAVAGPGRYPIYEGGQVDRYEDTVGEVVDELDTSVQRIMTRADITEAQADAIREELARFRDLAKAAYESAHRSQQLSDTATDLMAETREINGAAAAPRERRPAADVPRGTLAEKQPSSQPTERKKKKKKRQPRRAERKGKPGLPPRPPEPSSGPATDREARSRELGLPPVTAGMPAELKAHAAITRAELAKSKAAEAEAAAVMAARDAREMQESLRRLNSMVKDAALTAHGLPEDKDDAADARVDDAQDSYRDAYASVKRVYGSVNVRLDRAYWVSLEADQVLRDARDEMAAVRKREGQAASPGEVRKAVDREKLAMVGRASSRVDVQTARFFAAQRPPREDNDGERLSIKFGDIPEPPPRKQPPADKPGEMRPYQAEILADLAKSAGSESVLVVAPTGAGKTVILSSYIAEQRAKGKTVAFIAGTDELLAQARGKIGDATGETPGLVQGSKKDFSRPVTVISHGTVASNPYGVIPKGYKPDILIIDEAHHAGADGYRNLIKALGADETGSGKLVGFTATPYRSDGQPLDKIFGDTVCRVDTGDLINQGYLLPPTVVDAELTGPGGRKAEINDASNLPELYADGIAKARAEGRRKIIVFVAGGPDGRPTDVVQRTTDELKRRGISAGEVMGSTTEADRKRAVARFNRANEGVLINYGTLNEGFDAPSTDAIILGRNTESVGTLAQIVGRGMRPDPGNKDKRDVLVLNYSSRPAADVERLVFNQAAGDGKGITCGSEKSPSQGRIRFRVPPPTPRKSLVRSTPRKSRRRDSGASGLNYQSPVVTVS